MNAASSHAVSTLVSMSATLNTHTNTLSRGDQLLLHMSALRHVQTATEGALKSGDGAEDARR